MQQFVVIWWCIIEWQQCQCFIEYGLRATSLLHGLLSSLPLTIFRSNSKFDQNLQCSGLKWICGSQRNFSHVTWRVQDFVVVGQVYFKLEYSKCWSNFEFDRNIVSRMGARSALLSMPLSDVYLHNSWDSWCISVFYWSLKLVVPCTLRILLFSVYVPSNNDMLPSRSQ